MPTRRQFLTSTPIDLVTELSLEQDTTYSVVQRSGQGNLFAGTTAPEDRSDAVPLPAGKDVPITPRNNVPIWAWGSGRMIVTEAA